jgi:hypothetical protein
MVAHGTTMRGIAITATIVTIITTIDTNLK